MMMTIIKKNKLLFLVALTYFTLLILAPAKASQAFSNSGYYFLEMVQILPVIFLLTVAIEVLVPKEWILKNLGENSGAIGYILSLTLGSLSAGPIYAAFPICKTLLKKGASIGNIVVILSAWAVIKVPMLANEAKFLGPQFMVIRWILTVILIVIMGYVMNRLIPQKAIPSEGLVLEDALQISDDYCIGCGLCVKAAPEIFTLENKKAKVVTLNFEDHVAAVKHSITICPTKAITLNELLEVN